MPDDLRTRIAAAIYNADIDLWDWLKEMNCGTTRFDMADAVIAELKQQWRADYGFDGYDNYETREEAAKNVADYNHTNEPDGGWQDGEQAIVMHRYVTEWETDDE